MHYPFNNQVAVITGGTSGIGKAIAIAFLRAGAKVAVCGRNEASLNALEDEVSKLEINAHGRNAAGINTTESNISNANITDANAASKNTPEAQTASIASTRTIQDNLLTFPADVSSESDCAAFIAATLQHFGQIDILINNAGMSMRALFKDADLKVLKTLMDINFWGTVYCTKYALPHILKTKGTIAGISSIAGYRGLPARTGYSSSKFAMQGFLESLRTENLHTGVNVMWVSPGFTASNIRNTSLNQDGQAQGDTPLDEAKLMTAEEVADRTLKAIAKRKRQVVFTSQGKLTVLLNHLIPGVVDKLVFNVFKKEPNSPLK